MNAFTIKDLENLSGIKAHTIRIWEQRYGFLKPQRTSTNIRYYSNDELKAVLNIALLNKYGYKISHIDRMQPEEISNRILSLSDPRAVQERVINELVQMMVDMDMERFEKILAGYISSKGMERMISMIIFPFLEKIGILWQTGHINPAQEHLVTNVIRQKLIAGIENCSSSISINKTLLLFLPEGEHHELGLLYMYFMLKSRGVKVIYLGSNVPISDIAFVANLKKPDLAYVHLTSTATNFNFEKFLHNASTRLQGIQLVISGHITLSYRKSIPPNVQFKRSLSEVMEFLSML
ncbi:MAG TPA: MerR family transcriptional regulator [Chitinophagaceae bacterium]|nr:MerR family transcriptional regulator [Chitinophagaceae bacterium]